MGNYSSNSEVTRRLPYRTISSTSDPSTGDIDQWITESEAVIDGALSSIGVTVPVTNATGIQILRTWVNAYAEGSYRIAVASAGGDGSNDDGKDLITKFDEQIKNVLALPGVYSAMFAGGSAAADARRVRGYVLDNADSKSVSGGDFEPVFTIGEKQ